MSPTGKVIKSSCMNSHVNLELKSVSVTCSVTIIRKWTDRWTVFIAYIHLRYQLQAYTIKDVFECGASMYRASMTHCLPIAVPPEGGGTAGIWRLFLCSNFKFLVTQKSFNTFIRKSQKLISMAHFQPEWYTTYLHTCLYTLSTKNLIRNRKWTMSYDKYSWCPDKKYKALSYAINTDYCSNPSKEKSCKKLSVIYPNTGKYPCNKMIRMMLSQVL